MVKSIAEIWTNLLTQIKGRPLIGLPSVEEVDEFFKRMEQENRRALKESILRI